MTKETRTDIQIYSAIVMLLAGVALATAGFIVVPTGEISDSVLLFFAQCLIYAGSIFGVSVYIHTKFAELKYGQGHGLFSQWKIHGSIAMLQMNVGQHGRSSTC